MGAAVVLRISIPGTYNMQQHNQDGLLTVLGTRVNAHHEPGEQPVADVVAEVHVVEDGVGGGALSLLLAKDAVLNVRGLRDGVGAVGARSLDIADQGLIPEELADVWDRPASQGSVLKLGCVLVEDDVLQRVVEYTVSLMFRTVA